MHWNRFAADIEFVNRMMQQEADEEEARLDAIEANERFSEVGVLEVHELHLYFLLLGVKQVAGNVMSLTDENLRRDGKEQFIPWLADAQRAVEGMISSFIRMFYVYLPKAARQGNFEPVAETIDESGVNSPDWSQFRCMLETVAETLNAAGKVSLAVQAQEDRLAAQYRDEFVNFDSQTIQELILCCVMGTRAVAGIILSNDEIPDMARELVYEMAIIGLIWTLPFLPLELTHWKLP